MTRTVINNVRVFDGERLLDQRTVVINGDHIGIDPAGAHIIDGAGGTVLPGLIDAHVHVTTREHLETARRWGVTTMLDMGSFVSFAALRGLDGLPDIRTSTAAAVAPGQFAQMMGFPAEVQLSNPDQIAGWLADRVQAGADYIKLIVEEAGALDGSFIGPIVAAAHQHDLLTIAHATSVAATRLAIDNGVDFSTHAPLDAIIEDATVQRMLAEDRAAIPTLTMMRQAAAFHFPDAADEAYGHARDSVTALHRAGVPILLGTDAHPPMGLMPVTHGEAVHDELALLVEAGLTPVEALTAATANTADRFGLTDRGRIAEGQRADLILIDGDPTEDITASRAIRRVWCGGEES
ncbi:MAG TPA: amidohydrolase family protein [Pseudonocardiaceae bacterium]